MRSRPGRRRLPSAARHIRMIPCRTHRPDERAILGNMGEDLGPLLPTGGWNFLILMVVVYIVPIGAVALVDAG